MGNSIEIAQALHGYADGHSLLARSTKFHRKSERTMLLMSDLSGPGISDGFHSYLTGYPLHDEKSYAIARTWYAPEMERPGCVWTHTLILTSGDLERIRDLRVLADHFERPLKGSAFKKYMSSIIVPEFVDELKISAGKASVHPEISLILEEIYRDEDYPVFLAADNSGEYEDLMLAVWTQQWPGLRNSFSFCTGSLDIRELLGRPLDFQIVPTSSYQKVKRKVNNGKFVDPRRPIPISDPLGWLAVATKDFGWLPDGDVSRFLWAYGGDASGGRTAYARLIEVFMASRSAELGKLEAQNLIEAIGRSFPKKGDASALKNALVDGGGELYAGFKSEASQQVVLKKLLTTSNHDAFSPKRIGLRRRGKRYWEKDLEAAAAFAQELTELSVNPLGEEFLVGLAQGSASTEAIEVLKSYPVLLEIFVTHSPRLATYPSLWDVPVDLQLRMFSSLEARGPMAANTASRIVTAIFGSDADVLADRTIALYGAIAAHAILDWVNSSQDKSTKRIGSSWRSALLPRSTDLLDWVLDTNDPWIGTLASVASLLNPNSSEVLSHGLERWIPLTWDEPESLDLTTQNEAMSFLLVVGFHSPGPAGAAVVAHSFKKVSRAIESNELPYESWRYLSDVLPSISWWRSWDRRERLMRGLVEHFVANDLPLDQFLVATDDPGIFDDLMNLGRSDRTVWNYLRKIAIKVSEGAIRASGHQQVALQSVLL